MAMKDYYAILGVSPDADRDTIRTVFRKLCHIYHPDKGLEGVSQQRIKDIYEAYEVLSDPEQRAAYDRQYKRGGTRQTDRTGNTRQQNHQDNGHTDNSDDSHRESTGTKHQHDDSEGDRATGAESTNQAGETEANETVERLTLFRWPEWQYQRYLLIAGIPTGVLLGVLGIAAKVALFAVVGMAVAASAAYAGIKTDWLHQLEHTERSVLVTGQASLVSTTAVLGITSIWLILGLIGAIIIIATVVFFIGIVLAGLQDF